MSPFTGFQIVELKGTDVGSLKSKYFSFEAFHKSSNMSVPTFFEYNGMNDSLSCMDTFADRFYSKYFAFVGIPLSAFCC